jgi:hypothetical protein
VSATALLFFDSIIYGLIVAALYLATYLSLVHLLRYPRQWQRPPSPALLTTAGLATVLVAYISFSTDGLDIATLVASASFLAVLLFLIAAPAIELNHAAGFAPRLIEYLARHGDYSGLWMLLPALVVSFTLANVKLLVFLATAILIEIRWFLRHRSADRHRRLSPIEGHDLAVLRAQAQGDIKGFAQRHGIRELVVSDDAVAWRGCNKETRPCPFNLYVNRLGLNTAPCCREHMQTLSRYASSYLTEMNLVYWLDGGTLLGAVRENGGLLAWEDDIDVAVYLDDTTTWRSFASRFTKRGARDGYTVETFEKRGYLSISFNSPGRWPFHWERNRMRGEIRVDLVVYRLSQSYGEWVLERRLKKGTMPLTESGVYGVPRDMVLPVSKINFLGSEMGCPNQPQAYLRVLYGDYDKPDYTYLATASATTRQLVDNKNSLPVR